jgi:exonuclease VII large subunit
MLQRLEIINPLRVLQRGYSVTRLKSTGAIIKHNSLVQMGDIIITELAHRKYIDSIILPSDTS